MAEPPTKTGAHGVVITQRDIFNKVEDLDDKLVALTNAVGEMVAINKRLDSQHDRQNGHGERIRALEIKVTAQAVIIGIMTAVITAAVIAVFVK